MKNKRTIPFCILIFCLGVAAGVFARGKGVDPATYKAKSKQAAGMDLLNLARSQAGKGSWENIAVGRVCYLAGSRNEGQAIFDAANSKKADSGNWMRIGRVYWEAKDWAKAKVAFDKALAMEPKDAFPDPPKDMRVKVTKEIEGDGFVIHNTLYESRPGLWVAAFRP